MLMKLPATATLAAALCLTSAALSQAIDDPADLRGERPAPRTGLELPIDNGASALQQALLRLRTRASLMMIVAHPDDEDGGMLTYEARGHGVRAATLTLTRGEGGQNLMTADFNDALGLIRTQELLAADRYFGTQQYFGTEVDFGFSKTREEALSQWTHDRVLYDAVRAVRLFRPLVITSVFTGNPTDGHGHHQVAGQMAQEVFTAAADPKVFPEMHLPPWAPLKVYARVPFAQASAQGVFDYATQKWVPVRFYNYVEKRWVENVPKPDVIVHEGEYSDALGMSYVQFARQGLALQKSQIGAGMRVPPSGAMDAGYTRYGSRVASIPNSGPQTAEEQSFFDGIDISLQGIASLAPDAPAFLSAELVRIAEAIESANTSFHNRQTEQVAPHLAEALQQTESLIAKTDTAPLSGGDDARANVLHELHIKRAQLQTALAIALGVSFEANVNTAEAVAGTPVSVHTKLATATSHPLPVQSVWMENTNGSVFKAPELPERERRINEISSGKPSSRFLAPPVAFTSTITRPYFTRTSIEQPFYDIQSVNLRNAPATPPALTAWAELRYKGVNLPIGAVVVSASQPLSIIPPISLSLPAHAQVLPIGVASVHLSVQVLSETNNPAHGTLHLSTPQGWSVTPSRTPLAAQTSSFTLQPSPRARTHPAMITAQATIAGQTYTEGFRSVGYKGLTHTNLYASASTRIVPITVEVSHALRVAYLPGTGDEVPELLENIGVHPTILNVADLTTTNLSVFDVLVLGVRAYTAHDLAAANPAILDFARKGGTVIVQYQSVAFDHDFTPFPFHLGGNGQTVSEELAPVALSPAASGVLSTPNRITADDFANWVEERGHGFPASWDSSAWESPTEVHDAGQDPQRGGLLIARTGRGYYAYCAFALYRQMPEAVPGAYRLFANLLSLGRSAKP